MEALTSLLDSLAWPEYPSAPGAQAAFIAAGCVLLLGLAMVAVPGTSGRFLGLESRSERPGAIGELRVGSGYVSGLALAALLFDQPVLYTLLGAGLATAAFGRVISLMSDHAGSIRNVTILLLQIVLAAAALAHVADVLPATPGFEFTRPDAIEAQWGLYVYGGLAVVGAVLLLAPGIAARLMGVSVTEGSGQSALRSAGGLTLATGIFCLIYVGNPEARDMPFDKLLYINLGMAVALCLSVVGRLIALAFNRGNYLYAGPAFLVQVGAAAAIVAYVGAMM